MGNRAKIGIDLVEVSKVQKVFEDRQGIQQSVFTSEELRDSVPQRRPYVHLAARFAAKEAFFKALGTGLSGEMGWRDVELQREAGGKFSLKLYGMTARIARDMGVADSLVSISRAGDYAAAVVVLVCSEQRMVRNLETGKAKTGET